MSDDTDGNFNKFLIEAKHMKKLTEEIMMDIEGGKISFSLIPSLIKVRNFVMQADNNYYQKGKFRKQYNWLKAKNIIRTCPRLKQSLAAGPVGVVCSRWE